MTTLQVESPVKLELTEAQYTVIEARYLDRDPETGQVCETPEQMMRRIARHIASAEETDEQREYWYPIFLNMLMNFEFLPNTPCIVHAGRELGALAACYVLPIEDSIESIYQCVKETALVHKTAGGTGFDFSKIRPKNSVVASTGHVASGPVSFMKVIDAGTEAIKQGSVRRGANMGVLNVSHPDIYEFLDCKTIEGKIANFNISVGITDKFMKAAETQSTFNLEWGGTSYKQIEATELFSSLAKKAWIIGDPGVLFLDTANQDNYTEHQHGKYDATNPCVPKDTWIMTEHGPSQVQDVVGKSLNLVLDGQLTTTEEGFFKTGNRTLYRVQTQEGYEFKATADHLVRTLVDKTRDNINTTWRKVSDLVPGNELLINNHQGLEWSGKGTLNEGYLLGLVIGDGNIQPKGAIVAVWSQDEGSEGIIRAAEKAAYGLPHRSDFKGFMKIQSRGERRMHMSSLKNLAETFGMMPKDKYPDNRIEKTSYGFHIGFIRGLFDSDGSVQGSQKKGCSVRLTQSNLDLLKRVQRMLLRLGIACKIYTNRQESGFRELPNGKGGYKEYYCKASHELVIANDNMKEFQEVINFNHAHKRRKLSYLLGNYKQTMDRERFLARVISVENTDIQEDVYDIRVPGVHAFDGNGFHLHNCGEIFLHPNDSCTLGSINVSKFVRNENIFDSKRFIDCIHNAVRFLDNVVTLNKYPLPQIRERTLQTRRIGLGIMGFADALRASSIHYDEEKGRNLAKYIMSTLYTEAATCSEGLAEEKGTFPLWESVRDNLEVNIPGYSKQAIERRARLKANPRRNSHLTTIAPTGSISMIAGCSQGIEPLFAKETVHKVLPDENHPEGKLVRRKVEGSQHFKTANAIDWEDHILMQAEFQKYNDCACSKTINMPNSATIEDVKSAYIMAWKEGCKGITIYRDGSRNYQVLNDASKLEAKISSNGAHPQPKSRPDKLPGFGYKIPVKAGSLLVDIYGTPEKPQEPFEVKLTIGKSSAVVHSLSEALGRLCSLWLRSGGEPEYLIRQMIGIGDGTYSRWDGHMITSIPDAVARAMMGHIEDISGETIDAETLTIEDYLKCPDCGGEIVYSEGCETCSICGHSKCDG